MHDIKAIRDDATAFVRGLQRRGLDGQAIANDLLAKDKALRELLVRLQNSQARRNEASKLIGQAKAKKDEAQAAALMAEVAGLKDDIQRDVEQRPEAQGFALRDMEDHMHADRRQHRQGSKEGGGAEAAKPGQAAVQRIQRTPDLGAP